MRRRNESFEASLVLFRETIIARKTTNQTCFPFISYSHLIIDLSTKQFHDIFFSRFSRGNLLLDRVVLDDFWPDNCLRSAG